VPIFIAKTKHKLKLNIFLNRLKACVCSAAFQKQWLKPKQRLASLLFIVLAFLMPFYWVYRIKFVTYNAAIK